MRRSLLLAIILAAAALAPGPRVARAQADAGRWEVGGQLYDFDATNGAATVSRISPCQIPPCPVTTATTEQRGHEPGFGARLGYGFSRHVTAEAEVNYFPRGRGLTDADFTGGRKLQGLFGVKAGRRYESFGLFAKARPGFVNFAEGDLEQRPGAGCVALFPPPLACFDARGRTDFALDVGGVVELYPSARTVIRFDAGDTILFTGAHRIPVTRGLFYDAAAPVPGEATHNFQGGVGFGFRF